MAREPEWLRAQRWALGARLSDLRRAEGLTQAGFARALGLGRYERTSIAHVEKGDQSASRPFWERADVLLHAGGVLLAGFDELERARQSHEQAAREHARAERIAKASGPSGREAIWVPNLGEALVAVLSSWHRPVAASAPVASADGAALQWL